MRGIHCAYYGVRNMKTATKKFKTSVWLNEDIQTFDGVGKRLGLYDFSKVVRLCAAIGIDDAKKLHEAKPGTDERVRFLEYAYERTPTVAKTIRWAADELDDLDTLAAALGGAEWGWNGNRTIRFAARVGAVRIMAHKSSDKGRIRTILALLAD